MRYLLLVGHAGIAEGVGSALEMLLGPRAFVVACGLGEGEEVGDFEARLTGLLAPVGQGDEVVVLGDIAGGAPLRTATGLLEERGVEGVRAFGGVNLAMAISAVMGIEDGLDLDAIRDAVLVDGAQAVREA